MKKIFPSLFALALATLPLLGQGAPAASAPRTPIDVLTEAERNQLEDDHQKALKAAPQLLQDEARLRNEITEAGNVPQADAATNQRIMKELIAHRQALEAEMLKLDPSIKPVLDKIHAAQAQIKNSTAVPTPVPTNTPPPPQ